MIPFPHNPNAGKSYQDPDYDEDYDEEEDWDAYDAACDDAVDNDIASRYEE